MKDFAVYVFFALLMIVYAWNIPVTFAFTLGTGGIGVGAGAFIFDGAVKRAKRNLYTKKKRKRRKLPKAKMKAIFYLLKRIYVERIFIDGVVNLHDAALSALLTGAVWAAAASIPDKLSADVVPGFGEGKTRVFLSGILWARLGHIIVAGAITLKLWIRERYEKWKDTRLKG